MKYMYVEIHPVLAEAWYMADVSREVTSASAHLITTSSICDPALVMWSRQVPQTLINDDGLAKLSPQSERASLALYVCTAEEAARHVRAGSLGAHVRRVRDLAGAALTLVVFGVNDYFKSCGRKTMNSSRKLIGELDLELAITDLLVTTDCDTVLVNSSSELALLIVQHTKAIAEAPYKMSKRAYDEQSELYLRGENRKCVTVDKQGNGVSRLWQQMIAVLPHSSLETSRALCAKYPTPLDLYESLNSPDSVNELANIGVSRTAVPGSKARRIGPEFARKLHTLFTVTDGDILLD